MGWTGNRNCKKTRRRHRPQLELLDDRCLLSTGIGTKSAALRLMHQHAQLAPSHVAAPPGASAASNELETPAGTLTAGAATAYDPIIGAAQTRSTYNVNGAGMAVAVIDTGVDYNNEALGGGFGPGTKVIAGYDFADNSPDPMATSSQHGTAIAGLIGSSDPNDLGVAPGVNIVALRVTDNSNTASLSSIASALEWVIQNHQQYNITAVNMSLSDGGNYAQNWFAGDGGAGEQVTNLIGQLTAMNIPVIAATGNNFNGQQGEGFAAIAAGTISVTATDLEGNLLPNAQRLGTAIGGSSATVIAAPGEGLTAPSGDSGTASVEGTSFAAALVTGAVTLLQQIYVSRFGALPTVAQIVSWLQGGSTPIHDSVTGINIGELNIPGAAALIPAASQSASSSTGSALPTATLASPALVIPGLPAAPGPVATTSHVTTSPATPVPTASLATSTATATSGVVVYLNGQPVGSSGSSQSSGLPAVDPASFAALLQAMSWWAGGNSPGAGAGATQVQIWNA